MIIAFIIWTLVALFYVGIGITSYKAKEPVGFFAGVKAPEVTDIKAYNKAVSTLWFVWAILLEAMGVPFLFLKQNSPYYIFVMLFMLPWVISMVVVYLKIERKYKKSVRVNTKDSMKKW